MTRNIFSLFLLAAALLPGQTSQELEKAQQEVERLRPLVEAGAAAPVKLQKAQEALLDAQDDRILRQYLFDAKSAQDLSESQATDMLAAAKRRIQRQEEKVERTRALVAGSVLAPAELKPLEEELGFRRQTLGFAEKRIELLKELQEIAAAERQMQEEAKANPLPGGRMVKFTGKGSFNLAKELPGIEQAFARQFGKALPVSALGATATHMAMGYDHRGRVDVAIHPDQPEGQWLLNSLRTNKIPFYAFRGAIAGSATGAHIHIGPPSLPFRAELSDTGRNARRNATRLPAE